MVYHMTEEADHIPAVHRPFLQLQIQLALGDDRRNGGEMIATEDFGEDGRLTAQRPGAYYAREEVEGRLVYADEGSLFSISLFFRAGQVSSRHRAMASSSRWQAWRAGFWRVNPQRLSNRVT